jgi:hypothetical protein
MRWLHSPIKRRHALFITVVFGPLALVFTIAGLVALVMAPPVGILLLFSSLGGWFLVFFAWRMVGADPVTMDRPKDLRRRAAASQRSLDFPLDVLEADTPEAAAELRKVAAELAQGQPTTPAVHLVLRSRPGANERLERVVAVILAGLRDGGALHAGDVGEVVVAECQTDAESPGLQVTLLGAGKALAMRPPGTAERTVSLHTLPTDSLEAGGGWSADAAPQFADLVVRDPRPVEAVLDQAVASATGGPLRWLRLHRTDHLPVALAGAVGRVGQPHQAQTTDTPTLYRCSARPLTLKLPPRLASWDAKESPSQQRLAEYLDHLEELIALEENTDAGPLGLLLDVGLGREIGIDEHGHDLDNYLFPVAHRLGADRFVLARATKSAGTVSTVAVGPAEPDSSVVDPTWATATAHTTTSATTAAWKHEVIAQLTAQVPEQPQPRLLAVELALTVGPLRNWVNLWKQAIDALGPVVGLPDPSRPFTPRDDLIVSLGLHRMVDPTLGNAVRLNVWWREVDRP